MILNIPTIVNNIYNTFAGNLISALGTDSKNLLSTAATYLIDAKAALSAIGIAALAQKDPMSWQEVKLKLAQEGKIAETAFISLEQDLASDIQSFVKNLMSSYEQLLTNVLLNAA